MLIEISEAKKKKKKSVGVITEGEELRWVKSARKKPQQSRTTGQSPCLRTLSCLHISRKKPGKHAQSFWIVRKKLLSIYYVPGTSYKSSDFFVMANG